MSTSEDITNAQAIYLRNSHGQALRLSGSVQELNAELKVEAENLLSDVTSMPMNSIYPEVKIERFIYVLSNLRESEFKAVRLKAIHQSMLLLKGAYLADSKLFELYELALNASGTAYAYIDSLKEIREICNKARQEIKLKTGVNFGPKSNKVILSSKEQQKEGLLNVKGDDGTRLKPYVPTEATSDEHKLPESASTSPSQLTSFGIDLLFQGLSPLTVPQDVAANLDIKQELEINTIPPLDSATDDGNKLAATIEFNSSNWKFMKGPHKSSSPTSPFTKQELTHKGSLPTSPFTKQDSAFNMISTGESQTAAQTNHNFFDGQNFKEERQQGSPSLSSFTMPSISEGLFQLNRDDDQNIFFASEKSKSEDISGADNTGTTSNEAVNDLCSGLSRFVSKSLLPGEISSNDHFKRKTSAESESDYSHSTLRNSKMPDNGSSITLQPSQNVRPFARATADSSLRAYDYEPSLFQLRRGKNLVIPEPTFDLPPAFRNNPEGTQNRRDVCQKFGSDSSADRFRDIETPDSERFQDADSPIEPNRFKNVPQHVTVASKAATSVEDVFALQSTDQMEDAYKTKLDTLRSSQLELLLDLCLKLKERSTERITQDLINCIKNISPTAITTISPGLNPAEKGYSISNISNPKFDLNNKGRKLGDDPSPSIRKTNTSVMNDIMLLDKTVSDHGIEQPVTENLTKSINRNNPGSTYEKGSVEQNFSIHNTRLTHSDAVNATNPTSEHAETQASPSDKEHNDSFNKNLAANSPANSEVHSFLISDYLDALNKVKQHNKRLQDRVDDLEFMKRYLCQQLSSYEQASAKRIKLLETSGILDALQTQKNGIDMKHEFSVSNSDQNVPKIMSVFYAIQGAVRINSFYKLRVEEL